MFLVKEKEEKKKVQTNKQFFFFDWHAVEYIGNRKTFFYLLFKGSQ